MTLKVITKVTFKVAAESPAKCSTFTPVIFLRSVHFEIKPGFTFGSSCFLCVQGGPTIFKLSVPPRTPTRGLNVQLLFSILIKILSQAK